jgi:hypothetical protein
MSAWGVDCNCTLLKANTCHSKSSEMRVRVETKMIGAKLHRNPKSTALLASAGVKVGSKLRWTNSSVHPYAKTGALLATKNNLVSSLMAVTRWPES